MTDTTALTIILPTYNEAENLAELIPEIEERFEGRVFRILVVDDASPDGTAEVARDLNQRYGNIEVLIPPERKGLGAALRLGYDHASTPYILSSDADLSFGVDEMLRLYETIQERGDDLVQGTRHEAGGHYEVTSARIWMKKASSVIGNFVVRRLAGLPVTFRDRRHGESKLNLLVEIPKFLVRMVYYVARYRFTGYQLEDLPRGEEGTSG